MAITERTRPYETLIRHNADGSIGAHHQQINEVVKDGEIIAATVMSPLQISGAGLELVLGEATVQAIANAEALAADLAAATESGAAVSAQLDSANQTIADLQAQIAELTAVAEA